MLSSTQGLFAESIFITECISKNIEICQPINDVFGYDFVVVRGSESIKVQVKSCSVADNRYKTSTTYKIQCRRGAKCKAYEAGSFDYLAAYIIPLDIWYIIGISELNKTTIRVNPDSLGCKFNKYKSDFKALMPLIHK